MPWVIIGIVALVLAIRYSKQMVPIIGTTIGIIAILTAYTLYSQKVERQNEDQVEIMISYGSDKCAKNLPISVSIRNNSPKTVNRVEWRLAAYQPGYSTNLINSTNRFESDKILKPKESVDLCYSVPSFNKKCNPSELEYKVDYKMVYFAK